MASTDNIDLSSMSPMQLQNVCKASARLISQIKSGAPAPGGCLYYLNGKILKQSIIRARHISGSVNAAPTLSVTHHKNSKVSAKSLVLSYLCFSLCADLELIFICDGLQSNEDVKVLLTLDDRKCLKILHLHGVDSHKLQKLIDQSVNQAGAILGEYAKYAGGGHADRTPAQLAKAFLNGVFSDTVANLNEKKQCAIQIPSLTNLLGNDETPDYFKADDYLGDGNGIISRLQDTTKGLQKYAPCILESVADSMKQAGSAYTELFLSLDKSVMGDVSVLVKSLGGGVTGKLCQDGHVLRTPIIHLCSKTRRTQRSASMSSLRT
jgi:hypothetical protein